MSCNNDICDFDIKKELNPCKTQPVKNKGIVGLFIPQQMTFV